jgi:hypothetical protein
MLIRIRKTSTLVASVPWKGRGYCHLVRLLACGIRPCWQWPECGYPGSDRRRSWELPELPLGQVRYGLWEHEIRIEIGVICATTVPGPPTGIQGKLH